MTFLEDEALAAYTTMGVGGAARWFAEAKTEDDVIEGLEFAKAKGVPCFVLGGGSNLIVADEGYAGLVLRIALRGIDCDVDAGAVHYSVAAGEEWDALVARAVGAGYGGVECLSGIPGTIGGTPVQNVGAYGQEVSETVSRVRALDRTTGKFVDFAKAECGFGYRRSRFNRADRGKYIITRVGYRLESDKKPQIEYRDLKRYFQHELAPNLEQIRDAVLEIRDGKGMLIGPKAFENQSAGSFFKNPVISEGQAAQLESMPGTNATMPRFSAGSEASTGSVKLSAAWLIEQAGFQKGYALGRAGISPRHTLALVNRGGAKASELFALRDQIVAKVKEKFGVELEMEPEILG
jgi:UDP-N-acetylmuramate dehydrogenase